MPTYDTDRPYGLRALLGANVGSDIDAGFDALADDVANNMAGYTEGTAASRPVSTVASPGIRGRIYRTTVGANAGALELDTGTGWAPINQAPYLQHAIPAIPIFALTVGGANLGALTVPTHGDGLYELAAAIHLKNDGTGFSRGITITAKLASTSALLASAYAALAASDQASFPLLGAARLVAGDTVLFSGALTNGGDAISVHGGFLRAVRVSA